HDAWLEWPPAWGVQAPPHGGILVLPAPQPRRGLWLPEWAAGEISALLASGVPLTNALHRWMVGPASWVRF
ncbi:MAG: hypothetical protein ACRDI2_05730, partial [Chloroflexota bacterium]